MSISQGCVFLFLAGLCIPLPGRVVYSSSWQGCVFLFLAGLCIPLPGGLFVNDFCGSSANCPLSTSRLERLTCGVECQFDTLHIYSSANCPLSTSRLERLTCGVECQFDTLHIYSSANCPLSTSRLERLTCGVECQFDTLHIYYCLVPCSFLHNFDQLASAYLSFHVYLSLDVYMSEAFRILS